MPFPFDFIYCLFKWNRFSVSRFRNIVCTNCFQFFNFLKEMAVIFPADEHSYTVSSLVDNILLFHVIHNSSLFVAFLIRNLFLDTRRFAGQAAKVVQFGAAHLAPFHYFNFRDGRAV